MKSGISCDLSWNKFAICQLRNSRVVEVYTILHLISCNWKSRERHKLLHYSRVWSNDSNRFSRAGAALVVRLVEIVRLRQTGMHRESGGMARSGDEDGNNEA